MNKLIKIMVLSTISAMTVAAPLATASAHDHWDGPGPRHWGGPGPRYWDGPRYRDHHHHHHGSGRAVTAGVVGLAAGAIIGSALSQPSQPQVIYQAPPPAYYPPAPAYYPSAPTAYKPVYQPWTPAWHSYCSSKYRSFNPRTGTYRGVDGLDHFCN